MRAFSVSFGLAGTIALSLSEKRQINQHHFLLHLNIHYGAPKVKRRRLKLLPGCRVGSGGGGTPQAPPGVVKESTYASSQCGGWFGRKSAYERATKRVSTQRCGVVERALNKSVT